MGIKGKRWQGKAYNVHALAEDKDEGLILDRLGLEEEEVGEGEVEEGDGGDDCGG